MNRVAVRVTSTGKIQNVERDYIARVGRAVNASVQIVRTSAIDMIQRSPKTGKTYNRRGIRHKASAPGEPPATDTGFLVSQIYGRVDADKLGGQVESRAPYSRYLEFGTINMAARPFLFPALEMNRTRIRAIFARLK
jgi:HK97 gp10 family phage protein